MKNIHVIPTDKPSRLLMTIPKGNLLLSKKNTMGSHWENKNIYITSDEEIKDVRPHKGKWQLEQEQILNKFPTYLTDLSECKLVIMTTDQDLIKDGVQAIDDEFLEWFVKNPSCEEIELKKGFADGTAWGYNFLDYKIIIPQEEPKQENCCTPVGQIKRYVDCVGCDRKPKQEKLTYTESAKKEERISNCIMMKRKQETLEEVAERYASQFIKGKIVYHGFIEGAEWMQERMYSEEDMRKAFIAGGNSQIEEDDDYGTEYDAYMEDWFEKFKKK